MSRKNYLVIIILWLVQTGLNAQNEKLFLTYAKDTVYIDQNDEEIDRRLFDFKNNSSLFYGLKFENDKTVLFKIRYSYMFGKIKKEHKEQLFKLLSSRNKIDTTQIMVIHYNDTLRSISEFADTDGIAFSKDSLSHRHVISHKTFLKQHKKCIKKFKGKKSTDIHHFYLVNNGHPENIKKYTWQKDHFGLLRGIFNDSYKNYKFFVINPKGEFFVYNREKGVEKIFSDIISNKKWDTYAEDFEKRLISLDKL